MRYVEQIHFSCSLVGASDALERECVWGRDVCKGLDVFDGEAFAGMPLGPQLWLVFLVSTFAVGLVVFAWKRPIARWAAGGFLVSGLSAEFIFSALGLPTLGGSIAIMHLIGSTPALVLLLIQRPFLNPKEGRWYRIWSGVITCAILISFVFDIQLAVTYIRHFSA